MKRFLACVVFFIVLPGTWSALAQPASQPAAKKQLDHDAYDIWNTILDAKLSDNGQWLHYTLKNGKGDVTLVIRQTGSDQQFTIPRGTLARFSADGKFAVYLVGGEKKDDDKDKSGDEEQVAFDDEGNLDQVGEPKPGPVAARTLGILDLQMGKTIHIPKTISFRLPEKGNWLAYLVEKAEEKKPEEKKADAKPQAAGDQPGKKIPPKKETPTRPGDVVLRNLETGTEARFIDVTSYILSDDGKRLAFITVDKDGKKTGVDVVTVGTSERLTLASGEAKFNSLTFAETGDKLAFLSNRDDLASKTPVLSLYYWQVGRKDAQPLVKAGQGLPAGWGIASGRQPSFSKGGQRLFFGTAPLPKEAKKGKNDKNLDKVKVDIWHYKDPLLQPMQLVETGKEQNRTYLATVQPDKGQVIQLATKDVPDVIVGSEGDGDFAVGDTDQPYRHLLSWDFPGYRDVYLIDVKTGTRHKAVTKLQGRASLSPGGKYLTWWDAPQRAWMALAIKDKKIINLTKLLPCPVHNEEYDMPSNPPPYGMAGWVKDDKCVLLYDAFDIWAVDPDSVLPPVCVTDKFGRDHHLRFRYEKLDPKEQAIDPTQPMLLSAFHTKTKATGYYTDQVSSNQLPQKLICLDEYIDVKARAKSANKLVVTRSTFSQFPDLWVCDASFQGLKQVSHANPQQKDYQWGKVEQIAWTSLDGVPLNGLLYKPENFDAAKKYPMLVYFYERNADNLHKHFVPAPSRSIINISFYVSRGYVVFVPDIVYKTGMPGQSCVNCVLPGVTKILDKGFVDPKKVGVQGHSWGGYQISYLLTKTKIFAAAEAGAPVSNMTSAYGGIRWTTGMSRMFQYEKSQSRIGGTLWNSQQKFIENSPIFWADQITTPLLMLHNDKDGAVPWYQGIELFVALRRHDKPCWMLNYNGEDHGILKRENSIDFSIRMAQFFDHYLKGEPPPEWLVHGVPAAQKGKTLGLDLVPPDGN